MKRITIKKMVDEVNFSPRVIFYKDDKEFARFTLELVEDLTRVLGTQEEAEQELITVLRNELNDPELEPELLEVWRENIKHNE